MQTITLYETYGLYYTNEEEGKKRHTFEKNVRC
jgi:hypothetical protein